MKPGLLKWISLLTLFSCGAVSGQAQSQESPLRPNIVLIVTDQQRGDTIARLGNRFIRTPNFDRLAAEGTALTNAFANTPVCAPSRTSLYTGMHTSQHRTYSNHHAGPRTPTNLPAELKRLGYRTVMVGKNHTFLDGKDIDKFVATPRYDNVAEDLRTATRAAPWSPSEDPTYKVTNAAIDEISARGTKGGKPLFLILSYIFPHDPFQAPEPYFSMYGPRQVPLPLAPEADLRALDKPYRLIFHKENVDRFGKQSATNVNRMIRTYYGMISFVDHQVGRLLEHLDRQGLAKDTLVVFTSDHGDYMGELGLVTKSPSMRDSITNVPLIFRWPNHVKANAKSSAMASTVDIMPTILSLIDAPIPWQVGGVDLSEVLKGRRQSAQAFIVSEYGLPGDPVRSDAEVERWVPDFRERPITFSHGLPWEGNPFALAGMFRMIRTPDWKLVYEPGGKSELYDIRRDKGELVNLFGRPSFAGVQRTLMRQLLRWERRFVASSEDKTMAERNLAAFAKCRRDGCDPNTIYAVSATDTY